VLSDEHVFAGGDHRVHAGLMKIAVDPISLLRQVDESFTNVIGDRVLAQELRTLYRIVFPRFAQQLGLEMVPVVVQFGSFPLSAADVHIDVRLFDTAD